MLFTQVTYIGIDLNGRKLTYAALNQDRRLLWLTRADVEDTLAFLAGQQQALVAVNAPYRPNYGLMKREDVRARLRVPPRPGHYTDLRLADYLLQAVHIHVPSVPEYANAAPGWMRRGFDFYKRLEKMGCRRYPVKDVPLQWLEVNSLAAYTVLMGHNPLPRHSLEGRLQRQLLLYEDGLGVNDPMNFFEEITRHKLLHGILPLEQVYTPEQLDALMAAYVAWLVSSHPDKVTLLGDVKEGRIVLPVQVLKEKY